MIKRAAKLFLLLIIMACNLSCTETSTDDAPGVSIPLENYREAKNSDNSHAEFPVVSFDQCRPQVNTGVLKLRTSLNLKASNIHTLLFDLTQNEVPVIKQQDVTGPYGFEVASATFRVSSNELTQQHLDDLVAQIRDHRGCQPSETDQNILVEYRTQVELGGEVSTINLLTFGFMPKELPQTD